MICFGFWTKGILVSFALRKCIYAVDLKNEHTFSQQQKKWNNMKWINTVKLVGTKLMTALAVIGITQDWLVVGMGRVALSLSRLMSLNALLKTFSEILCDTWRAAAACWLPRLSSVVLRLCGLKNWAKICPCLFLLPACAPEMPLQLTAMQERSLSPEARRLIQYVKFILVK